MRGNETVSIEFLGSAEGAKRAANETVAATQRVGTAAQHTSSTVKKHAEEAVAANALLTGSFTRMARSAVTAGAGFAAAYIAIAKGRSAIENTAQLAYQTEQLHRNLGLTVKSASGLEAVLKARGIDANSAAIAFQTLSRQVVAAETGSKKTQAAFAALGITTKDLKAAHGDLNILLPKVAEGFGSIKGSADRAAVGQLLLSRGFRSLLPLFAEGAKGFNDQISSAQKFGAVLDQNTLKKLNELHAAQIKNKEASLGLQIAFTTAITPALLSVSTLTQKLAKDFQGPGSLDEKMGRVGKDLGPALDKVEKLIEAAIPQIANHVGKDAPKVAEAFVNGFEHADVWGKLAIGAFFLRATGGWGKLATVAGERDGASFGSKFIAAATAFLVGWAIGDELYKKVPEVRHAADAIAQVLTDALHPHIKISLDPTNPQFRIWFGSAKPTVENPGLSTPGPHGFGIPGTPGYKQGGIPGLMPVPKGGATRVADVLAAAQKFGVDPSVLWGIYGAESSFGKAKSSFGLTSDYPGKGTSGNFNKDANRAAQILANLVQSTGSLDAALRKYSGGSYGLAHIHDVLAGHQLPGAGGGNAPSYSSLINQLNQKPGKPVAGDLAWARSMIGHFKETGFNTGPELDQLQKEFGTYAAAWCAEFATKALVKAGFPKGVMTSSVESINAMAKNGNFGLGFTTSPKPGDLVTFGNQHVAIIESVDKSKGIVHTIAGNTGQGDVSRSTYALGRGKYISVNAAGAGKNTNLTPTTRAPAITQQQFTDFIQAQLDHFDLMLQLGLISGAKDAMLKRGAIRATLPALTGDNRLKALIQLRALTPFNHQALNVANSTLGLRDSAAGAASMYMTRAGIDPNSVAGLQFTGRALQSRMGDDQKSQNFLYAALWNAKNTGDKAAIPGILAQLKAVGADEQQTLTDIAQNTRDTAAAVAAQTALIQASGTSSAQFFSGLSGPGATAVQGTLAPYAVDMVPGDVSISQMMSNPAAYTAYLQSTVLPPLMATFKGDMASGDMAGAADIWQNKILPVLQAIAGNTDTTAQNTQDLSDFWKQQALSAIQGFRVSQSQYGVFAGSHIGSMPFLGGFDAGGTVPGPRGAAGMAVLHGGETVLPTHKQGMAPAVHVYVSADASAMGVRVDHQIGRSARQRSVAPGH